MPVEPPGTTMADADLRRESWLSAALGHSAGGGPQLVDRRRSGRALVRQGSDATRLIEQGVDVLRAPPDLPFWQKKPI
jgi:hypothetical protein